MAKQSNLVSETTMYSINPGGGQIVVHHLPWPRTSPQLQKYIERGFTFEKPQGYEIESAPRQVEVVKPVVAGEKAGNIKCRICGRPYNSELGLKVHMGKSHKKEK